MSSQTVAVIGGACAGSEIAAHLQELGMQVVVFDQNPLPYGKIEDGLPRWHHKLQMKEMHRIDEKLDRPGVSFVPQTRLGEDIQVDEMISQWGFSFVVMANGAWRDRTLRVPGADQITDQSLVYQNAFVYWFNHYPQNNYSGPVYEVQPGTIVVGGGLASLDMVKLIQLELVTKALKERGIEVDQVEMEHHGIHKKLEEHGLSWDGLGIKPARLYYRKRVEDMPLVPLGDHPSPEKLAKAEMVRAKIIGNAQQKFAFEVYPLHSPAEIHHRDGRAVAMSFKVMSREDGRFVDTGRVERVETSMIISSIGSIPQPIPGIPMNGEQYHWEDMFTGEIKDIPHFYCVGNAITGRGNIKESSANARRLSDLVHAAIDGTGPDYEKLFRGSEEAARVHVERFIDFVRQLPELSDEQQTTIAHKVAERHKALGYESYASWRDAILARR